MERALSAFGRGMPCFFVNVRYLSAIQSGRVVAWRSDCLRCRAAPALPLPWRLRQGRGVRSHPAISSYSLSTETAATFITTLTATISERTKKLWRGRSRLRNKTHRPRCSSFMKSADGISCLSSPAMTGSSITTEMDSCSLMNRTGGIRDNRASTLN